MVDFGRNLDGFGRHSSGLRHRSGKVVIIVMVTIVSRFLQLVGISQPASNSAKNASPMVDPNAILKSVNLGLALN